MQMAELTHLVSTVVRDGTLGYDQKLRRLAALATEVLPYPTLSVECQEALEKRIICDLYEGHAPFTPRYVLPDYEKALRQGVAHLELAPPATLDDALPFLLIMYSHVPSATTYPVYLGDLDTLLMPYVEDDLTDDLLDAKLRRFWISIDRMFPDAFAHADVGPGDNRVVRSILRVDRLLHQSVPNLTLKVDPVLTPDTLVADGVRTVFETGKPHFANHPLMVADLGERYAVVSCDNSLRIGGGAHTLVRLNLREALVRHGGGIDAFLALTLPHYVELAAELAEARLRSLVEEQRFFETHWLATEGLISLDRFTAMFGIFGLAECVNLLLAHEGHDETVRCGHHPDADELAGRIVDRVAELVAARPMPYCEGTAGRCTLHAQGGIDLDRDVTAGTRIPVGEEPGLYEHIRTCVP